MSNNAKISIALGLTAVLVVVVIAVAGGGGGDGSEGAAGGSTTAPDVPKIAPEDAQVIRDDSHRLQTAADGRVTLVEFLDFECEACGALFPVIERLREEYKGRVTFAFRYFPIQSHFNAQLAAQAVESAANQGKVEEMYKQMFETQTEWAEQQVSARDTFLSYAEELGLDMQQFEEDLDSSATAERVARDQAEGEALGVEATPTLFLNGEKIEPGSYEEMKAQIDAALG